MGWTSDSEIYCGLEDVYDREEVGDRCMQLGWLGLWGR